MWSAFLLLQSLAATPEVERPQAPDECAVLGIVAREHLGFGKRASPPLRASGRYIPHCPWPEMGVKIGTFARTPQAKLVFRRPRIKGTEAVVSSLVIQGALSGAGWECRLAKRGDTWKLKSCRRTRAI